ncbi:phage anti-repressor protein [Clostridium acetobutylicum]|uniref:antA/AntB antirepressor family protein n=1 Tax=Clostridium acetobutylicum TaxID=1488 RepID=UPI0024153482|nr:antA/AntB antirepressor family protein [Clostridium acetobutylicum]NSA93087.1 phage anti-repressor protein [Clostridium acetobutylicum]
MSFLKENIDWIGVRHNDEGNETMDFAISIEFAKHIAMMAKTEKSHEYRNYFIKCEKNLKRTSLNV